MFTEKFKIVTDSSANLLPGGILGTVPLKIRTQEREYVDEPGLDVDGMVRDLRTVQGRTSTSCPNIQEWLDAFSGAQHVFGVTITSGLSGSFASAMQAKADYEEANPGAKVHIIDSLSTGPEMALLISRLQENIRAGMEFAEMVRDITAYQARTHLLFALQSVQNLARNGRVHPAMAKLVGVLNMRILGRASAKGDLETLHKVRGDKNTIRKLLDELMAHGYAGGPLKIDHCQNEEIARQLRDTVRQSFPNAPLSIGTCAGLCSYYAESGGLLIGFESPEIG